MALPAAGRRVPPGRRRALALAALAGMVLAGGGALAQGSAEAELGEIRDRIARLEQSVATEVRRRDDGAAELRELELDLARLEGAIREIDADIRAEEARERELGAATAAATARLGGERELLGEQVRLSFRTGRQEVFRLLLSQQDPVDLGRMLVYYDYMNRARGERIAAVSTELEQIGALAAASRAARDELARLRSRRLAEADALAATRTERAAYVETLDRRIADSGQEMDRLRAEERRLGELVEELAAALEGFPVQSDDPFSSWRGKLAWPLDGELQADYGDLREGGPLRWNGVVLAAAAGTPVRAVYHGRVAFADWLPGLGLLLVIDHGEEYMSLYGHNETLLRQPGDWVAPGEIIAEVGDTGGRRQPALYFEIRHRGEPEDPHRWIPGK